MELITSATAVLNSELLLLEVSQNTILLHNTPNTMKQQEMHLQLMEKNQRIATHIKSGSGSLSPECNVL